MRNVLVFQSLQEFKSLFSKDDFTCPNTIGYVYAVEQGKEIKIGYTSKLWTRLTTLEAYTRIYSKDKFGRIAFTEPIESFKMLEKHLHLRFSNKRLSEYGELFNITFENAVNALESEQAEPYQIEIEEFNHVRKTNANRNPRGKGIRLRNTINELYKGKNHA